MPVRGKWLAGVGVAMAAAALAAVPAAPSDATAAQRQAAPPPLQQLTLRLAADPGQIADVRGASQADGAEVIQWASSNGRNARWTTEDMGGGYVRLAAVHSGKCIDVRGAATADDSDVIQWTCSTGTNQQWRFVAKGNGYQIAARHSGKCLNVRGGTGQGNRLIQYSCTSAGAANDVWLPVWEPTTV
ncbi:RICIN domain-containing protein [Streptomyces albipurpureus]|uniref:RICIN domain-containing protein n=1 Tax=Streptomyces albipurpureus TaxID=2897419 RepID=A0ABT0URW2_9ACTN|nr:RICIN domain-containing protein [Streptomyces sp. CWNU-1]MCM2391363.1 RICIN domain-containing protein [Streptomyces sp. CWNU-1]